MFGRVGVNWNSWSISVTSFVVGRFRAAVLCAIVSDEFMGVNVDFRPPAGWRRLYEPSVIVHLIGAGEETL